MDDMFGNIFHKIDQYIINRLGKCEKCGIFGSKEGNLYWFREKGLYDKPAGPRRIYCEECLKIAKHSFENYHFTHEWCMYCPITDASKMGLAKTEFNSICNTKHPWNIICENKKCNLYCVNCRKDIGRVIKTTTTQYMEKEPNWHMSNSIYYKEDDEFLNTLYMDIFNIYYCYDCALKYD